MRKDLQPSVMKSAANQAAARAGSPGSNAGREASGSPCQRTASTTGKPLHHRRPENEGRVMPSERSMEIQIWPIDKLVFYARNPRKNDAVVDRMCGSIREFGFKIPCLVRSDGEVIFGTAKNVCLTRGAIPAQIAEPNRLRAPIREEEQIYTQKRESKRQEVAPNLG